MLSVSPVRCADAEDQRAGVSGGAGMEEVGGVMSDMEFDFTVDDIDFGDFFLRLEDSDALPDLEVDPAEIFTDFEAVAAGNEGVRDQEVPSVELSAAVADVGAVNPCGGVIVEENKSFAGAGEKGECNRTEEVVEGNGDVGCDYEAVVAETKSPSSTTSSSQEAESRHRSSCKHFQGKKKAKVDWTPELHRRFVQAVEQLGIDKAVPSRILEIMGIDSLTRHNIASHLQVIFRATYWIRLWSLLCKEEEKPIFKNGCQILETVIMEKYRSHRKHMLAREAEAASWTQRRQMYAAGGGAPMKRPDSNMWTVPTIGFPPPPPPPPPMQHFGRPLHVWGHPTMDSPRMPMWPRHLVARSPTPPWAPPPLPPSDPAFWHHHYMRGPAHMPTQGTPCMAMPMPAARFPGPPVPGVVPCPMYRPLTPPALASRNQQDAQLQLQAQPSSESIDAAIGDVLSKPWLPLPLGLKPPTMESVMGELQRQGVASVPLACG